MDAAIQLRMQYTINSISRLNGRLRWNLNSSRLAANSFEAAFPDGLGYDIIEEAEYNAMARAFRSGASESASESDGEPIPWPFLQSPSIMASSDSEESILWTDPEGDNYIIGPYGTQQPFLVPAPSVSDSGIGLGDETISTIFVDLWDISLDDNSF